MSTPCHSSCIIKKTAEDVALYACVTIIQKARKAILEKGLFKIVLAGGTTPERVYELLARESCDWKRWHVYLGDERCLPVDNSDRNSEMLQRVLLNKVEIPKENIHLIPAELGAVQAAKYYANIIKDVLPFDMVLLGMGDDGHTASLFPGHSHNLDALVHPVFDAPKQPSERVSLSVKALSENKSLLIIITGSAKHAIVSKWYEGNSFPVTQIESLGQVNILLDSYAARDLKQKTNVQGQDTNEKV